MTAEFFSLAFTPLAAVEAIGLTAGVVVFVILVAVAYVIFRLLRKSVRMAFRMAIVAAILVIALIGTMSFYWFGTGSSSRSTQKSSQRR